MALGNETRAAHPSDANGHVGDPVGRQNGGRRARGVRVHAVIGRLTPREQRLFEEAAMLLLLGKAQRRLAAQKETCHGS